MDSYVEPAETTVQPRTSTHEDQPCSSTFGEVSEQSPIPMSQHNKASYPQHYACTSEKVAAMKPSMSIVGATTYVKRTGTINSTSQRKRSKQPEGLTDAEYPD